jgi:hypothetical protein
MGIRSKPLRVPLTVVYDVAYRGVLNLWGIDMPYNVKVGRRLRIDAIAIVGPDPSSAHLEHLEDLR